jgi:hypothetical protein
MWRTVIRQMVPAHAPSARLVQPVHQQLRLELQHERPQLGQRRRAKPLGWLMQASTLMFVSRSVHLMIGTRA